VERALHRIAIVNRGEAAMRLVNAVSELRHELSRDIGTIALHTHAERAAMLMFDICVQNGSISDLVKARIVTEFNALPKDLGEEETEVRKMQIIWNSKKVLKKDKKYSVLLR
jgi:hypothetical protein